MVSVLSFAIIATRIYLHSQGSLLLPMLFRTSVNVSAMMSGWISSDGMLLLWWSFAALWIAAAGIVIVRCGLRSCGALPLRWPDAALPIHEILYRCYLFKIHHR
jgi:hypothetical protein